MAKELKEGDFVKIKQSDKSMNDRLYGSTIEIKRIEKDGTVIGHDPHNKGQEVDISNYEYEED